MSEDRKVKKCPYCAEEILAEAIKCKHCKSDLLDAPVEKQEEAPPPPPVSPTPPAVPTRAEDDTTPGVPEPPTPVMPDQGPPAVPPLQADADTAGSKVKAPPAPGENSSLPPASPPVVPPPPTEQARAGSGKYEYPKAGIGMRILAYFIDSIISMLPLVFFLPVAIIPFIRYTAVQSHYSGAYAAGPGVGMIILLIFAILIGGGWSLFYFLFRDGFGEGQSWGKRICGLMVVNLDNNLPCDKGKSFLRNIIFWVLSALGGLSIVELIVLLVHDKGHRLGDMVGSTQVIDVTQYRR